MKMKQNRSYSSKNLKFKSVIKAKKETIAKFNKILDKVIDHEEQKIIEGELK
ncbi:hypothetical protein ES705_47019 [subsurface metagenome]